MPEPMLNQFGKKITGLDDASKKMSKSAGNPNNYIALLDSPEVIRNKIKIAVTDSGSEIKYDEKKKPAMSNLLTIYSLFSEKPIDKIEEEYEGKGPVCAGGYAEFKKDLAEVVISGLEPLQKKYKELEKNPDSVMKILKDGASKAKEIASITMEAVKNKIGFV